MLFLVFGQNFNQVVLMKMFLYSYEIVTFVFLPLSLPCEYKSVIKDGILIVDTVEIRPLQKLDKLLKSFGNKGISYL